MFEKRSFDTIVPEDLDYRRCVYAYLAFEHITRYHTTTSNVKNLARYAIASVVSHRYNEHINPSDFEESIDRELGDVISRWEDFEKFVRTEDTNKYYYFRELYDQQTGEKTIEANWGSYYKGRTLNRDLRQFFGY